MGDFLLRLSMEKDSFKRWETIPVTLSFKNVGAEEIRLDGILPLRDSAEPPYLEIETDDGKLVRVESGVPARLMTAEPIVIAPGKAVVVLHVDLIDCAGWIRSRKAAERGDYGETVDPLGPRLVPGKYEVRGHFHPTPQDYRSATEPVGFEIL
jgi:hypothetical protein